MKVSQPPTHRPCSCSTLAWGQQPRRPGSHVEVSTSAFRLQTAILAQQLPCSYLTRGSGLLWGRFKELSETFFFFFLKCVLFFFWRIKYRVFGDLFFKCCFLCVFWHSCKLPTGKISLSLPGLHSVLNFGSDNSWKYFFSYWVLFRYGWETLKPWGSISVNGK